MIIVVFIIRNVDAVDIIVDVIAITFNVGCQSSSYLFVLSLKVVRLWSTNMCEFKQFCVNFMYILYMEFVSFLHVIPYHSNSV